MVDRTNIEELCQLFDKKLGEPVAPSKDNKILDEIFSMSIKNMDNKPDYMKDIETVVVRDYQDHAETREHLSKLIQRDIKFSLALFRHMPTQQIHVLVGSFHNTNESLKLLKEIEQCIKFTKDVDAVPFYLGCILQCLNKFEYKFADIKWMVKQLCLRMNRDDCKHIALLIFTILNSKHEKDFQRQFLSFVESLLIEAEEGLDDSATTLLIEILTELYPAFTLLCSSILLGNDLDKLLHSKATSKRTDIKLHLKILNLLAVACIDENVRAHISENYLSILEEAMGIERLMIPCALVLVKSWSFSKLQKYSIHDLATIAAEGFLKAVDIDNKDNMAASIESLVFLSLKVSVKSILRHYNRFCPTVVEKITSLPCNDPNLYGLLFLVANLGSIPSKNSKSEANVLHELKHYADLQNPTKGDNETKDDIVAVKRFNKEYVIDYKIISHFRSKLPDMSKACIDALLRIIYNTSHDRTQCAKCVEQGAVIIVLEYLMNKKHEDMDTNLIAVRSLALILIYTNPASVFNKYSPLSAIPFLFESLFISYSNDPNEKFFLNKDEVNNSDIMWCLLALTNLASDLKDGEDICKAIALNPKYWDVIESLMLDNTLDIRKSTLELICNLMSHPISIAAKFFNFENARSAKNFNTLVLLLTSSDLATHRAITGIFANIASSIPYIAKLLLGQQKLIEGCTKIFISDMEDPLVVQRVLTLFYSLFELAPYEDEDSKKDLQEVLKMQDIAVFEDGLNKYITDIEKEDSEEKGLAEAVLNSIKRAKEASKPSS